MKKLVVAALSILVCALNAADLIIIGDSTLAPRMPKAKNGSWGQELAPYCKLGVNIKNFAKSGRSVKSFEEEGWLEQALPSVQNGDFVIIQFGHNDLKANSEKRYSSPSEFKVRLKKYIAEVKKRGGIPVLVTPTPKNFYDEKYEAETDKLLGMYVVATIEIAKEENVMCVNLNALIRRELERLGKEPTKGFFADQTHPAKPGARCFARLFWQYAMAEKLPICEIFQPTAVMANARELILTDQAECVVIVGDKIKYVGHGHGIKPLMELYKSGSSKAKGGILVDKVIGRAAAFLAIANGIKHVHSEVMSEDAAQLLNEHQISCSWTLSVPHILNRDRSGLCPLEQSVLGETNADKAIEKLQKRIAELMANNPQKTEK